LMGLAEIRQLCQ